LGQSVSPAIEAAYPAIKGSAITQPISKDALGMPPITPAQSVNLVPNILFQTTSSLQEPASTPPIPPQMTAAFNSIPVAALAHHVPKV